MPDITILTERELRECVALDSDAVAVVEHAFAALATGGVIMPPILSMNIPERHGEVDVKTAYVPGLPGFAIKMSPGFFDNSRLGLPSLNGLMVLFSSQTGIVQAVLLDNGYLTDVRTAAAGAVAARHLAPRVVHTVGVLGAGVQADLQLRALRLAREFQELIVWARDPGKAAAHAQRMGEILGCATRVCASPEQCVRDSQVVITTTPAREPLIRGEWLHPGLHITAMGSDSAEKNELAPSVILRADRFVCDRLAQSRANGELRTAIGQGLILAEAAFDELGEICAGQKPGREDDQQTTVCDLTGTGVQDTAIASHAMAVAGQKGFGTVIHN